MANSPKLMSSERFSASRESSDVPPEQGVSQAGVPERRLSVVDCTSIIVGIIIGSGIYIWLRERKLNRPVTVEPVED